MVVPTYDRPARLDACLTGLARSNYPREAFEVIVVDDGSPTPPVEVVARHRDSLELRFERQPNAGPATARNRGAKVASGTLLAFTDDDCVPDPDWLVTLARHSERHPGHLIGGRTMNSLEENRFSAASQSLVAYLYEYSRRSVGRETWTGFFTSNNMAVPADRFWELGGFSTDFPLAGGEDRDFCARWSEAGFPSSYVEDATIWHHHRLTLRTFWRQHWNYGRGAYHFHRARARRSAGPHRPEPAAFYLGLIGYPFSRGPFLPAALESALLGVTQFANALGFFHEKHRTTRTRGT